MKIIIGSRSCVENIHCSAGTKVLYKPDSRQHFGVITKEYPYIFVMKDDNGVIWYIPKGALVCHELSKINE